MFQFHRTIGMWSRALTKAAISDKTFSKADRQTRLENCCPSALRQELDDLVFEDKKLACLEELVSRFNPSEDLEDRSVNEPSLNVDTAKDPAGMVACGSEDSDGVKMGETAGDESMAENNAMLLDEDWEKTTKLNCQSLAGVLDDM